MNRPKLAETYVSPDRLRILGVALSAFKVRAIWIPHTAAGQRRLDRLTGGHHHAYVETLHRNFVARFYYSMLRFGVKLRVSLLEKRVSQLARLDVRAMVDELSNGDSGSQLGHAAKMIAVPM